MNSEMSANISLESSQFYIHVVYTHMKRITHGEFGFQNLSQ